MPNKPQYYIVEASALPEVFLKAAETKRLLSTGEASTVNEATRMTDISRSAFYKYRDAVLPFQNMMTGRNITFQLLIHDEKGLLSELLVLLANANANIISINSIIPTNGTAKFFSPLGVDDFIKKSSIVSYSREALEPVHEDIMRFAAQEGLTAHRNSIKVRFE